MENNDRVFEQMIKLFNQTNRKCQVGVNGDNFFIVDLRRGQRYLHKVSGLDIDKLYEDMINQIKCPYRRLAMSLMVKTSKLCSVAECDGDMGVVVDGKMYVDYIRDTKHFIGYVTRDVMFEGERKRFFETLVDRRGY